MSADPKSRRVILAAALAMVLALPEPCCFAEGSGIVDVLPPQRKGMGAKAVTSRMNGLRMKIDTNWVQTYGYRPVKIRFDTLKPAKTDREIRVVLSCCAWRGDETPVEVTQDFVMPADAGQADFTMSVPQYFSWSYLNWQVLVDGKRDPQLCRENINGIDHPTNYEDFLGVTLASGSSAAGLYGSLGRPAEENASVKIDEIETELPDRWLNYSGTDVVRMTVEELATLAEKEPEVFAALRRWISTGGSLWLEQSRVRGDDFGRLPQVTKLLGIDRGPVVGRSASPAGAPDGAPEWRWVSLWMRDASEGIDFSNTEALLQGEQRKRRNGPSSKDWFAEATLGFGTVTAFSGAWNEGAYRRRQGLRRSFNDYWSRRMWSHRHGMLPDESNEDFTNWLIPGVGLAPVNAFRILITLFVLVAGPVSLWFLRRWQRTHLMVLTVPTIAALLTLSLITYATLSDGFGTQVRARSVTLLDQREGEQVVWSRLCYYAGMTPSEGLYFSDQTAVYPVQPAWNSFSNNSAYYRERTLEFANGQQRLGRGWLPTRDSMQLLTVQAGKSEARIDFGRRSNQLAATNRLGAEAWLLLVCDGEETWWMAEEAPPGKTVTLSEVDKTEAVEKLRRLAIENAPAPPEWMTPEAGSYAAAEQQAQRRQMIRQYGVDYLTTRMGDNLMNRALNQLMGLDGSEALDLPARSYVALTRETAGAELGMESVEESASFHVVIGRW